MGKLSKALGLSMSGEGRKFPGSNGSDAADVGGMEEAGDPGDDSMPSDTGDEFGDDDRKDTGKIGKVHVMAVKNYEKASTPESKAQAMKDLLEAYGAC